MPTSPVNSTVHKKLFDLSLYNSVSHIICILVFCFCKVFSFWGGQNDKQSLYKLATKNQLRHYTLFFRPNVLITSPCFQFSRVSNYDNLACFLLKLICLSMMECKLAAWDYQIQHLPLERNYIHGLNRETLLKLKQKHFFYHLPSCFYYGKHQSII